MPSLEQTQRHPTGDEATMGWCTLFRIGAGLRIPALINRLLLVDADLLGYRVPMRRGRIEGGLGVFTGPELADRLAQNLLIIRGRQQRNTEKTGLVSLLQGCQV